MLNNSYIDKIAQELALERLKEMDSKTRKSISCQTGDQHEFYYNISKNKNIRMYWCDTYDDYVLSINFGNCKKYIITRSMWYNFRKYIGDIDYIYCMTSKNLI